TPLGWGVFRAFRSLQAWGHLSARPAARRALSAPLGGGERGEHRGPSSSAGTAARRARSAPLGGGELSEHRGPSSSARAAARRAPRVPSGGETSGPLHPNPPACAGTPGSPSWPSTAAPEVR